MKLVRLHVIIERPKEGNRPELGELQKGKNLHRSDGNRGVGHVWVAVALLLRVRLAEHRPQLLQLMGVEEAGTRHGGVSSTVVPGLHVLLPKPDTVFQYVLL